MKKIILIVGMIAVANAGKVTWGADGKPHIEGSSEPVNGCYTGGINSIADNNSTKDCK